MKFEEIQSQQIPDQLDEVKMSTSVFDKFIDSDAADGMVAGFEAELCFRGMGESSYEGESEMDESMDQRARSIDDIIEFFTDRDYNDRRDTERLRDTLQEEFFEWQSEQMSEAWSEAESEAVKEYIENSDWDEEAELRQYMEDEMELTEEAIEEAMAWYGVKARSITSSKQQNELKRTDQAYTNYTEAVDAIDELLDERVQESIDNGDRNYENAREQWEEDVRENYNDSDWLRDSEYSYMTDVYQAHNINWPYWTQGDSSEGGYNEDSAERLGRSLKDDLDVQVKVATGYHSATRKPNLWIIEPDGSLEPDDSDDMPAEIISPPMPLRQMLQVLPQFYEWANSNDAYSNESTGFHIGVSLPTIGGRVDYVKLALFLGDAYVLEQFERETNTFTKSSMAKLSDEVRTGKVDAAKVTDTIKLMKSGLIELADRTIKRGGGAHGKYSSINVKGDYIEFRSMGGENYFNNPESLNKVLDTIKRYAYAMYIAGSPELFRDEYAKKLYKLLDKEGNNSAAMKEFADYVAAIGGADAQTVKNFMRTLTPDQYADASLPDRKTPTRSGITGVGKYWWNVKYNGQRIEVVASNKAEAKDIAVKEWGLDRFAAATQITYADITMLRPFKDSPGGVGNWKILANGQQVFRITASTQVEADRKAREWIASTSPEFRQAHQGQEFEVVPV